MQKALVNRETSCVHFLESEDGESRTVCGRLSGCDGLFTSAEKSHSAGREYNPNLPSLEDRLGSQVLDFGKIWIRDDGYVQVGDEVVGEVCRCCQEVQWQ